MVTLRVQNINGDGQLHGDVPFGFLTADVNSNRIVDRPKLQQVQTRQGPLDPVTREKDILPPGVRPGRHSGSE